MKIRISNDSETNEIGNVHLAAFGPDKGPVIAKLAMDLLSDLTAKPLLSLVAIKDSQIIGSILFTKAKFAGTEGSTNMQILAPLAIEPSLQKTGIGTRLIMEGLRILKESGTELVFVLGHPDYYPRCGFTPAGKLGFKAPYPIPEEYAAAWMVQELNGNNIGKIEGTILCSDVLNEPQHWVE